MIYTVITSMSAEDVIKNGRNPIQSNSKNIKRYIMNSWITQEQVSVILKL